MYKCGRWKEAAYAVCTYTRQKIDRHGYDEEEEEEEGEVMALSVDLMA